METQDEIELADRVFYLTADPLTPHWLRGLYASLESLGPFYAHEKPRARTYEQIVDRLMEEIRKGSRVCAVSYGHPGVFAYPLHETNRRARLEGHDARMLPAVSAEDCLFADLAVDPGMNGCQSFEATDFLIRTRPFDTSSHLILWQIGFLGELRHVNSLRCWNPAGVRVLADVLSERYGPTHKAAIYECAPYAVCPPRVVWACLQDVPEADFSSMATLYVPPLGPRPMDARMLEILGIKL